LQTKPLKNPNNDLNANLGKAHFRETGRSALAKQTLFQSGVTLWGKRDFAVFKRLGVVHVSMG